MRLFEGVCHQRPDAPPPPNDPPPPERCELLELWYERELLELLECELELEPELPPVLTGTRVGS